MMLFVAVFLLFTGSWGAAYPSEHHALSKRATTLLEQCPHDPTTNTGYHISLIGPHTDNDGPPATQCGNPKGSTHVNLHFDQCKTPDCHGCKFPFESYDQYKALEDKYLIPIRNWHAFVYAIDEYKCVCLYDSVTGETHSECVDSNIRDIEAIKDVLLSYVKDIQEAAGGVWEDLVELPWQVKLVVITLVVAAFVALLPVVITALEAAGIVIAAEVVTTTAAALAAGLAAQFGIPIPV